MKGLMRKFSIKEMGPSKQMVDSMESNKENLCIKRSLSLEAINKIINGSQESLKKNHSEQKRKLSGLSMRIRKISDTGNVLRRKVSVPPEAITRKTSIPGEMRTRKVSVQPDFSISNVTVPSEKRVRKGSLQPNMMGSRQNPIRKTARKYSVPANMKYSTEKVRVRRVSFVNQNTGEKFEMSKRGQ